MKLNMGCGHNKRAGFVNVDLSAACNPDMVCDLERFPWPWASDSVDEVVFNHSLEHLGAQPKVFLGIMKELYRVARPGAIVWINAPHPRHDNFINDPTHVRAITPPLLTLFDKKRNDEWKKRGNANTPLAHYLDVDFALVAYRVVLAEPYARQFKEKKLTDRDVDTMVRERNNIASEFRIKLQERKAAVDNRAS
jgi:hypothetical protein